MNALATITRPFALHRWLVGVAAACALLLGSAAWYFGSPLFLRTTADEALGAVTATLAQGHLNVVDDLHRGTGAVRIVTVGATRHVRFDDVAIANGPDLHVYLASQTGGRFEVAGALYLGPLKATNGSFQYEVPAAMDLSSYRSVVVWCRAFGVLFTWADLAS